MKLKFLFAFLLLSALVFVPLTAAQDDDACNVAYLFDAWARATPEGAPTGAVFGLLTNLSAEDDVLISVSTDSAEAVELHEVIMGDGDVMQMRPVEGGFAVSKGGYLELAPGGYHIMLINLTQPLVAGETLDLTLNFEHLGEVTITVPIHEMAEEGGMGSAMEATPEAMMPLMDWPETCAKIHVVGAWARNSVAGMPNSAAYGLLVNLTDTDDTLVSATTAASEVVELHEMTMGDNDVMQMRPVEGGIVIPAGGTAWLKPGGLHVMLIGLTEALEADATIDLTLTFENSDAITLTVPIREPMEDAMPMGG